MSYSTGKAVMLEEVIGKIYPLLYDMAIKENGQYGIIMRLMRELLHIAEKERVFDICKDILTKIKELEALS